MTGNGGRRLGGTRPESDSGDRRNRLTAAFRLSPQLCLVRYKVDVQEDDGWTCVSK